MLTVFESPRVILEAICAAVRTHVRAIYRKLQVHSVAEAVRKAIESGLC